MWTVKQPIQKGSVGGEHFIHSWEEIAIFKYIRFSVDAVFVYFMGTPPPQFVPSRYYRVVNSRAHQRAYNIWELSNASAAKDPSLTLMIIRLDDTQKYWDECCVKVTFPQYFLN